MPLLKQSDHSEFNFNSKTKISIKIKNLWF